jgi:hypothetical protein
VLNDCREEQKIIEVVQALILAPTAKAIEAAHHDVIQPVAA